MCLLYLYASRPEKPVTFKGEQIEFIVRVVEHLDVVLQAWRLKQPAPQKVFLLLGQGGSGKSELINFVKDLVDSFHSVLSNRDGPLEANGFGPVCMLAAGTNAAASNIGGDTIHSRMRLSGKSSYELKRLAAMSRQMMSKLIGTMFISPSSMKSLCSLLP